MTLITLYFEFRWVVVCKHVHKSLRWSVQKNPLELVGDGMGQNCNILQHIQNATSRRRIRLKDRESGCNRKRCQFADQLNLQTCHLTSVDRNSWPEPIKKHSRVRETQEEPQSRIYLWSLVIKCIVYLWCWDLGLMDPSSTGAESMRKVCIAASWWQEIHTCCTLMHVLFDIHTPL